MQASDETRNQHPVSSMDAAIRVTGLVKKFGGRIALDNVSLELRQGEVLGLLGPNGAGKSTTVRAILGRVRPESGSISVLGVTVKPGVSNSHLGYIPQEIALYPLLTARENLIVFGKYQDVSGAKLKEAIAWGLEWAALQDRAGDQTKTFSGGMKRRLNMAAGMIHRPRIVLLDEPTVGIDPQSRERVYEMIEGLRRDGVSMIYTTHYMEEAERLCDRIAIIDHGKTIALGTKDELVKQVLGDDRVLFLEFDGEPDARMNSILESLGGKVSGKSVRFAVSRPSDQIAELLRECSARNLAVHDLTLKSPSLESVFLQLTGRELRE